MSPTEIDRVFGRGRLRMTTGPHVEVFREPAHPGERRCYTKRFLATAQGDYREWTEREWRILARLVGHTIDCVPEVVQFDRGAAGATPLVKTYDAGVTVDHWASLLPVRRDGAVLRHIFDDCAHWWALAHHCLRALEEIHAVQLIHLDIKADNVCIPLNPPDFDPQAPGQRLQPVFEQLALIDFAFSLVSGEQLTTPLPIGRQADYDYQSPRLLRALEAGRQGDLQPTRELDWRCDMFSLAAMLERYLPQPERMQHRTRPMGWTGDRFGRARTLVRMVRDSHDGDGSGARPHQDLLAFSAAPLGDAGLAASLGQGWTLARDASAAASQTFPTPVTRIAPAITPIAQAPEQPAHTAAPTQRPLGAIPRKPLRRALLPAALATGVLMAAYLAFEPDKPDAVLSPAGQQPVEFSRRANDMLTRALPIAAAAAEKEIAWVMYVAASATDAAGDAQVADAAAGVKAVPDLFGGKAARDDARSLNESAREALHTRLNVNEAFRLQLRAFGANPQDPGIVGNLAFLYLRISPPQAEIARQLATYSLALRHSRSRAARAEDWATLAVASALTQRDQDAASALFVMAVLTKDLDASCRLALDTLATHGERMRGPVQALLQRLRTRAATQLPLSCDR